MYFLCQANITLQNSPRKNQVSFTPFPHFGFLWAWQLLNSGESSSCFASPQTLIWDQQSVIHLPNVGWLLTKEPRSVLIVKKANCFLRLCSAPWCRAAGSASFENGPFFIAAAVLWNFLPKAIHAASFLFSFWKNFLFQISFPNCWMRSVDRQLLSLNMPYGQKKAAVWSKLL